MLDHNACKLCLQEARVPQVCNKGHLFCRVWILFIQECIYENLINQKKQIEREQKLVKAHNATVEVFMD
jgi:nitric oxide synthase-interacting protein